MPTKTTLQKLFYLLMFLCLQVAVAAPVSAQDTPTTSDSNPGTAWNIRNNYFQRFPWAQAFYNADTDAQNPPGTATPGSVTIPDPEYIWPAAVNPTGGWTVSVPSQRDQAITNNWVTCYGYPLSDTQFQIIQRLDDNMMLEEAFDPERWMWMQTAMGSIQTTAVSNSMADLAHNQASAATGFCQTFLNNFTVDGTNTWNTIRNNLFIPMAFLLLLPGAVLSQVRAIVAQGSSIFGEVNPFDGILRAIIATFLIPATYFVVNYGIDVSNSITQSIAAAYQQIQGTNMYTDATCAEVRALPIASTSSNGLVNSNGSTSTSSSDGGDDAADDSASEAIQYSTGTNTQCQGQSTPTTTGGTATPAESTSNSTNTGLLTATGANMIMTGCWNVLCAFQMAYLYYLFCIGPVVAALWAWPMQQLRSAFPSWVEGVITICFWSLFWSTTILLLAAFKNVGDTGTIIISALNYLALSSVRSAFNFAGMVGEAAMAGRALGTGAMSHAGHAGGAGAAHGAGIHGVHGGAAGGAPVGAGGAGGTGGTGGTDTSGTTGSPTTATAPSSTPGTPVIVAGGGRHTGLTAGHTLPAGDGGTGGSGGLGIPGASGGGDPSSGTVAPSTPSFAAPPAAGSGAGSASGSSSQTNRAGVNEGILGVPADYTSEIHIAKGNMTRSVVPENSSLQTSAQIIGSGGPPSSSTPANTSTNDGSIPIINASPNTPMKGVSSGDNAIPFTAGTASGSTPAPMSGVSSGGNAIPLTGGTASGSTSSTGAPPSSDTTGGSTPIVGTPPTSAPAADSPGPSPAYTTVAPPPVTSSPPIAVGSADLTNSPAQQFLSNMHQGNYQAASNVLENIPSDSQRSAVIQQITMQNAHDLQSGHGIQGLTIRDDAGGGQENLQVGTAKGWRPDGNYPSRANPTSEAPHIAQGGSATTQQPDEGSDKKS